MRFQGLEMAFAITVDLDDLRHKIEHAQGAELAALEAELKEQLAKAERLEKEQQEAKQRADEAEANQRIAEENRAELKAELEENTRVMMAAQAQAAIAEAEKALEEENKGFFKKLFTRKK